MIRIDKYYGKDVHKAVHSTAKAGIGISVFFIAFLPVFLWLISNLLTELPQKGMRWKKKFKYIFFYHCVNGFAISFGSLDIQSFLEGVAAILGRQFLPLLK